MEVESWRVYRARFYEKTIRGHWQKAQTIYRLRKSWKYSTRREIHSTSQVQFMTFPSFRDMSKAKHGIPKFKEMMKKLEDKFVTEMNITSECHYIWFEASGSAVLPSRLVPVHFGWTHTHRFPEFLFFIIGLQFVTGFDLSAHCPWCCLLALTIQELQQDSFPNLDTEVIKPHVCCKSQKKVS